jgi:hypothetical protein
MEFASLQDAFPQDDYKKKKSRKSKEGFQAYELPPTDADRPAVQRMGEIPPFNLSKGDQNPEDELLDASSKFLKKPNVNNSLPAPRPLNTLNKGNPPSFFGAEPFTNPNEDVMAPFNSHVDQPNGYMLDADFTKSFDQTGFGKAAGAAVLTPELRQRWKPLSAEGVDTAFTNTSKGNQFVGLDPSEYASMKGKIDTLIARLDDLEYRAAGANPQMEMLSFIMTGLFLMFTLDIAVRKSGSMRLVNVR